MEKSSNENLQTTDYKLLGNINTHILAIIQSVKFFFFF